MTTSRVTIQQDMRKYYRNKRVLITGGTKGLGRAIVGFLIDWGAKVTVVARTKKDLEDLDKLSENVFTIQADMSRKEDIHRISGQAIGMMEGVDILINNASTLGPTPLQPLIDTECEELSQVLETNLLGPFRLIKAVLPAMKFMKSGKIINISSDASQSAYPTWGPYGISKAGLDHMTAIWQQELDHDGIQLVSVDPGDMNTELHTLAIPDANVEELYQPSVVARDLLEFIIRESFDQPRYSATQWRELL